MDTEGAVIYAGSFSKILCPGMRLAYCVCDKKLMAAFVVAKQCSDVHTNVWAQRVCEAMLTRTDMDAHIREIRKIYAAKAALMMEQLDEKCPQVRYTRPEGGMFIWGTLPEGADMPAFVRECLARKLALVPGTAFGNCGEGYLRVSYAYSLEDLQKAIERIKRFVARLDGEKKC